MPEIGLLPFARVAMNVATAVLPSYRSRFSKHQFTQPQLLAILCLMRYADWTFREAEVRLREHSELRVMLRLLSVPDHTTVYRFLRRLPDDTMDTVLGESVRRLRRSSRRGRRLACVAVDGTGLAPHAVSTYFIRRSEQHTGGKTRYKHFLKWLIVVDVDRQIILAQRARQGPWCDTRALPGLVDAARRTIPIGVVLADAGSTPKPITTTCAARWEPTASFRPNRAAASREEESVTRCTALFRGSCMVRAPK